MNKATPYFFALLLLGATIHASAADRKQLQTEAVVVQQARIHDDLQAGKGAYAKLSPGKRDELLAQQARLLQLLEGKKSSDELDAAQKKEAFAAADALQAAAAPDSERMICTREKTIGSNRPTRVCRSEAQVEADRRQAREGMDRRGGQSTN